MVRTAPVKVRKEAKLGLLLHKKWKRGGTAVGVARAVQLSSGKTVSDDVIKRMYSYFQRHQHDRLDKDGSDGSIPGRGYIAWLLWGGNSGRKWAEAEYKKIKAKKKNPITKPIAAIKKSLANKTIWLIKVTLDDFRSQAWAQEMVTKEEDFDVLDNFTEQGEPIFKTSDYVLSVLPKRYTQDFEFCRRMQMEGKLEKLPFARASRAWLENDQPLDWFNEQAQDRGYLDSNEYLFLVKVNNPVIEKKENPTKEENPTEETFYHLSSADFNKFKQTGNTIGFHFGTKEQALKRGQMNLLKAAAFGYKESPEFFLYTVRLDIKRPLKISENRGGTHGFMDLIDDIFKEAEKGTIPEIKEEMIASRYNETLKVGRVNLTSFFDKPSDKQLAITYKFLTNLGYDSISYENEYEGQGLSYIIFDPQQISIISKEKVDMRDYQKRLSEADISFDPIGRVITKFKKENPTKEEEVQATKDYLLELAKECGKRPSMDTPLGKKLNSYLTSDKSFKEKIKEVCPDWFRSGYGVKEETKVTMEMFLEMAGRGEKRPRDFSKDPKEKKLGELLNNLLVKYLDFRKKLLEANRDWFRSEERKKFIAEYKEENPLSLIARGIDERPASAYDREELKLGIKTELEHTDDAIIASKIAKDHLDEDLHYYSKLIEMESKMKKSNPITSSHEKSEEYLPIVQKALSVGTDAWVDESTGDILVGSMAFEEDRSFDDVLIRIKTSGQIKEGESVDKSIRKSVQDLMKKIHMALAEYVAKKPNPAPAGVDPKEFDSLVKKLKKRKDVDNPYALANWILKQKNPTAYEKLVKQLEVKGVDDPKALAAWIGRQKYGKEEFQRRAAAGRRKKS